MVDYDYLTRPVSTASLEGPVVRIVVALTATTSLVTFAIALASGEAAFYIHAVTSAFAALLGAIQLALHREDVYVLVMTAAAAIAANVTITETTITLASSVVALVIIGIGATLFATYRRPHIIGYAAFLIGGMWLWHDGAIVAGLYEGVTVGVVFAFGAEVINWVRDRADLSAASYEHLFRRAPVSLWREDFTEVAEWLALLRSTGVTDLGAYLDEDPARLREAASLIVVSEVNEAAVRLMEADGPDALVGRLDPNGTTESSGSSLRDQLLAVWDGRRDIVTEIRDGRTIRGNRLEGLLSFSVPQRDGAPDYSQATVAIVDVTESRAARAQLEELLASKDQLVAAVSHELRTPLTAIVGLTDELAARYDSFDRPEVEEFIAVIAAQSEDVAMIVEDLLVAAQAESGLIHHLPEPVTVVDQIRHALRGCRIDVDIPVTMSRPIGRAFADPGRVRQIIRNLVTNALRYGTAPIRIVVTSDPDHVVIEVRDAGTPLPDDQHEEIFNRYHRARERPGVAASVGIGLTVSRELARVMGGDLAYVHDGEAVFRLALPKWTGAASRLAG
jgi:signal transduction histidine kinase